MALAQMADMERLHHAIEGLSLLYARNPLLQDYRLALIVLLTGSNLVLVVLLLRKKSVGFATSHFYRHGDSAERSPEKHGKPPLHHTSSDLFTALIHADAGVENVSDVAPPLHLSTNMHMMNREGLGYARHDTMTRRRVEQLLGYLDGGQALMFSSGLAAAFTVLLHYRPKRVAVAHGYWGTQEVLEVLRHSSHELGYQLVSLEEPPQAGDVFWMESPRNPRCELLDIARFADRCHAAKAVLVVDATFASPVILNPLKWGADVVMHSSTKYLNGHGDALGGVLVSNIPAVHSGLRKLRNIMGNTPGNLEPWLLLRSLRTLQLRVERQSASAVLVARFLTTHKAVSKVHHPSLPDCEGHHLVGEGKQMRLPGGMLSFELRTAREAVRVLTHIRLWTNATSLGGVESLLDYRYAHDKEMPPGLLRASVGLEAPADLIADLQQALDKVQEAEDNLVNKSSN
jgi:cystathionine gamma-synthase